jgi:hypothetical protein
MAAEEQQPETAYTIMQAMLKQPTMKNYERTSKRLMAK